MSEPFVGEIQLFAFSYAPYQWAQCTGQTLPIQQNTALFSLLGTYYGGNGTTNYQLPNLVNRAVCNQGNGSGLTPRTIGEPFGNATVTLNSSEMPTHSHALVAVSQPDATKRRGIPQSGDAFALPSDATVRAFKASPPNTNFAPGMITPGGGGGQPHNELQPLLAMNFSIALYGVFPSFN